jgi:hypothetical protein
MMGFPRGKSVCMDGRKGPAICGGGARSLVRHAEDGSK